MRTVCFLAVAAVLGTGAFLALPAAYEGLYEENAAARADRGAYSSMNPNDRVDCDDDDDDDRFDCDEDD